MTTNQESRQANLREQISTTNPIVGDWHAFWDSISVPVGTFNERMLTWINTELGTSYTNVLGAMHAFADSRNFDRWSDITGLDLNAAQALVVGYSSDGDGFAAIFESRPSIYVADTGTPANDTSLELASDGIDDFSAFFTYTSPAAKNVMQADGTIKYAAHNLVPSSDGTSSWTESRASISSTGLADADGGTTAFEVTEDNSPTTTHRVYIDLGFTQAVGSLYRFSVRAKRGTGERNINLRIDDGNSSGAAVKMNLGTGNVTEPVGDFFVSANSTDLGGGWYQLDVVSKTQASPSSALFYVSLTNAGESITFSGDNSSSIIVSHCHVHAYPADTTYLATTTAARYALPLQYSSGVAEGLLVEPAATNIITNSNDYSSGYEVANGTATQDTVSPSGETDAWTIADDSAGGTGAVYLAALSNVTVSTSTEYTFSVYMKADGLDWGYIFPAAFTTPSSLPTYFDLVAGEVDNVGTGVTDTNIEDVGNGWYRCSITFTTDGTDTEGRIRVGPANENNTTVDLDGTSSIKVWQYQLETGSVPTSLIKTFGATATRAVDKLGLATSAFPISASERSWYVKGQHLGAGTSVFLGCEASATDARDSLVLSSSLSYEPRGVIRDANNNALADIDAGGSIAALTDVRFAVGLASDDFAAAANGTLGDTDNSGAMAEIDGTLGIGRSVGTAGFERSLLKEIAYFPERLKNPQLEDITSGVQSSLITTSLAQYWVANETNALSLDFTDSYFKDAATSDLNGSAYVLDASTPANDFDGVPDDLLTYTTTSVKNVLDASGNLTYAAHNFFKYSNDFSNWTPEGSPTLTAGQPDPDGGNNATLFAASSATNTRLLNSSVMGASGSENVIEVTAKYSGGSGWLMFYSTSPTTSVCWFDVKNGVKGTEGAAGTSTITPLGDGWYRCKIQYTATATSGNVYIELASADGGSTAGASDALFLYRGHGYNYPADTTYIDNPTNTAGVYALPYDHYTSGTLRGILVEPAATNVEPHSQNFEDWSALDAGDAVITDGSTTGPDGVANSATLLEDANNTGTATVSVGDLVTVSNATVYTYSIYAKANGLSWIAMRTPVGYTRFDLSSGAVGTADVGHTSNTIEDVGNGWYRCWFKWTTIATGQTINVYLANGDGSGAPSVDKDGTSSVYLYGAQLETGSVPTSLVKTFGSTATRAADEITLASADTATPWDVENSMFAEFSSKVTDGLNHFVYCWDGTSDTDLRITVSDALEARGSTAPTAGMTVENPYTVGGTDRVAMRVDSGDFAASLNGTTAVTDATATTPSVTDLDIGHRGGVFEWNGHIKRLIMVPRLLIDADLESWSTTGDLP